MKAIEITLWIAGAALLALFAGMQAWGEIERQRDLAAFAQARQTAPINDALRIPPALSADTKNPDEAIAPADTVLAILRIPGIALELPVSYGTDERVLLRGAGLVEGTAMPGSNGNVGIAAHRDTHFRALKDLSLGDRIELALPDRTQVYVVTDLWVVEPTDVHILDDTGSAVLTLVTCYPFYFVGNAPQRFVVRAVAADSST
ncbi:MAG: class D sortase [Woeseia sp.]